MRSEDFVLLFVVLLVFIDQLKGQTPCLASNNQRWKTKSNRCVDCRPCPSGARNFTEPYDGPSVQQGNTKCLPCRACPSGSFIGENGCQPCRILCEEDYKREFVEICEGSHDARCGSCLFGYEDTYRNIEFACMPKVKPTTNTKPEEVIDKQHMDEPVNNSTKLDAEVALRVRHSETKTDDNTGYITMCLILGIIGMAAITGAGFILYKWKYKRQISGELISQEPGGEINDIQIDGGGSQYSSKSEVRGELPGTHEPLLPHPELPGPSNTGTQLHGNVIPPYTVTYVYEHQQRDCQCPENPDCRLCYTTSIPNKQIKRSDDYILIVSTNICHSERQLYVELKLSDAEIHAKEDDRRTDPKDVTLQEKVLSLLNRWVEIGPAHVVTLQTLMKALCKSKFHKINEKLIQKLKDDGEVDSLENDNGGQR